METLSSDRVYWRGYDTSTALPADIPTVAVRAAGGLALSPCVKGASMALCDVPRTSYLELTDLLWLQDVADRGIATQP